MKAFALLFEELDATTSTNSKISAIAKYFRVAQPLDAAWAVYFLTGRRFKRFIASKTIRNWTLELTNTPEWLYQESYNSVGDTAECCALLLDSKPKTNELSEISPHEFSDNSLSDWIVERILPLGKLSESEQRDQVTSWWSALERFETFILNKLLTGSFRVGVSQNIVSRALSEVSGLSTAEVAHSLMGNWSPTEQWYESILKPSMDSEQPASRPYPFYLASSLEQTFEQLGPVDDWQAEWKWDGIRAQLIRRGSEVFIWSRGEELITDRLPEISQSALDLNTECVLDGEVLAMDGDTVLPFGILQKRIGRKAPSKSILQSAPVGFMVYDIIELSGVDIRNKPLSERREILVSVLENKSSPFHISPVVSTGSWEELAQQRLRARELGVEGLMLKRLSSIYQSGRRRGDWWKWKIEPFTVDAVLLYAQAGSGRRANLFTDYTFAVWSGEDLVPIAKAYSGLSDEEISILDDWIRKNTKDRFGPVRSVKPQHVFELAFEGINSSPRHKSGVALRFPRILKWRHDKKTQDADQLSTLQEMIRTQETVP